jgi:histidinol-phosphatase (PHP family)
LNKYEPTDLIDDIMNELVKRNIALEINSSPIRKGYSEVYPSDAMFEAYLKYGGAKVTIGSDAHRCEEIGQDFDRVGEQIEKYRLQIIGFAKRKEVRIVASEQTVR